MRVTFPRALLAFLIGLVAATALTPEQQIKVRQYYTDCVSSSGVSEAVLKKARQGQFTDDRKFKVFLNCFFKKTGFQNAAGDFQLDVIRAKMPAEINRKEAERIIAKCKNVKGTDAADTAYKGYKCYWNATPNHMSLM